MHLANLPHRETWTISAWVKLERSWEGREQYTDNEAPEPRDVMGHSPQGRVLALAGTVSVVYIDAQCHKQPGFSNISANGRPCTHELRSGPPCRKGVQTEIAFSIDYLSAARIPTTHVRKKGDHL